MRRTTFNASAPNDHTSTDAAPNRPPNSGLDRRILQRGTSPSRISTAMTISITQAEAILEKVQADRSVPKPPYAGGTLTFQNPRRPSDPEELSPLEEEQLVTAGADGMGEARTAEGWLSPDDESFAGELEVWDLVDEAGTVRYSIWIYLTDNATVFHGTSSVVVGGASQGGLECGEAGLKEAILAAPSRMDTEGTLVRFLE